jgi:hypothetical protein
VCHVVSRVFPGAVLTPRLHLQERRPLDQHGCKKLSATSSSIKALDISASKLSSFTNRQGPQLGPSFVAVSREFAFVGASHGWAHDRACQLAHHALRLIQNYGLEDLEGGERLFSYRNRLAHLTRDVSASYRELLFLAC